MIVADANLLVYLTVEGPHSQKARRAFDRDPEWRAPRFWRVEYRNAVLKHVRAGEVTPDHALGCFANARELIGDSEPEADPRTALELALAHGISAYDAEYVAVARALGVKVVSSDTRLVVAVPDVVVSLESFVTAGRA